MVSVRSLLETLPLCCGATDRRGRVAWVNAAAARLAGSTPAKLVGADIRSLWPHAPVPRPTKPETKVEHAVIGGRSVWLRVTRFPVGRQVVAVSEEIGSAVRFEALRVVAGIRCEESRPVPAAVGKLLLGGYDVTDISALLNVPFAEALSMCSDIVATPRRH